MAVTVLTPTGTLGYGYGQDALANGLHFQPNVIAVDAGSTDPGPYYLGAKSPLVSRISIKRELDNLITSARSQGIPIVVGSAGGVGSKWHVDWTVDIVREIVHERELQIRLAWIYADVPVERVQQAIAENKVEDFEAGYELTHEIASRCSSIVAQMGHEPLIEALGLGADVVIAGRACDDSVIAALPIAEGCDPALAIHMGKILECGAFCAEPFGMDVMMGFLESDHFLLEPGSRNRRASATSVAAHSLYERENPFVQHGPGYSLDLSHAQFDQVDERRVRVSGARMANDEIYRVKLEGAEVDGYRTICIAGIRCPTMIARIDELLDEVRQATLDYFGSNSIRMVYHIYGKNGVMGSWEPENRITSHELGLVIDVVAASQDLARAACHFASGRLLHKSYDNQFNTSGNLAFPYSPSEIDAGPVCKWSVYHLMQIDRPMDLFPIECEELG